MHASTMTPKACAFTSAPPVREAGAPKAPRVEAPGVYGVRRPTRPSPAPSPPVAWVVPTDPRRGLWRTLPADPEVRDRGQPRIGRDDRPAGARSRRLRGLLLRRAGRADRGA